MSWRTCAIRDALTPAELPERPGLEAAAAFLPAAAERVSGDFFRVAAGPQGVRAALGDRDRPAPGEAIAVLRARVADFAYGALTDDLCLLAARIR